MPSESRRTIASSCAPSTARRRAGLCTGTPPRARSRAPRASPPASPPSLLRAREAGFPAERDERALDLEVRRELALALEGSVEGRNLQDRIVELVVREALRLSIELRGVVRVELEA